MNIHRRTLLFAQQLSLSFYNIINYVHLCTSSIITSLGTSILLQIAAIPSFCCLQNCLKADICKGYLELSGTRIERELQIEKFLPAVGLEFGSSASEANTIPLSYDD